MNIPVKLSNAISVSILFLTGCSGFYLKDLIPQQNSIEIQICNTALSKVVQTKNEIRWDLTWYDDDGGLLKKENCMPTEQISLNRDSLTPIIAVPVLSEISVELEPNSCLGGLFPLHAKDIKGTKTLNLCPEKGSVARTMERVLCNAKGSYKTGEFIASHFNWTRFTTTVFRLSHPQWLDSDLAAAAILSGSFSIYRIKERQKNAVQFTLMDERIRPGTVFYEMWNDKVAFEWPPSQKVSIELPDGLFHLFSNAGYLSIQVDKAQVLCSFYTEYLLKD